MKVGHRMHKEISGPHASDDLAGVVCGRDGVEHSTTDDALVTCKDCRRLLEPRCVRCGAPYTATGTCSRREHGCQGGRGEYSKPDDARSLPEVGCAGIQSKALDTHGELELELNVNGHFGSCHVSRNFVASLLAQFGNQDENEDRDELEVRVEARLAESRSEYAARVAELAEMGAALLRAETLLVRCDPLVERHGAMDRTLLADIRAALKRKRL